MLRFNCLGAVALLVGMVCAGARGAAVPPDSVASDTVAVIHVSAKHFNPEALRTAAQTVLGQNAAKADEGINKFKEKFDKAVAAGVESMTMVIGNEKKGEGAEASKNGPATAVYIHAKAGSDPAAIKDAIIKEMPAEEQAKTVIESKGDYLVMYNKEQPLPTTFDAGRAQLFADALASISEMSLQVAFIPDAKLKEQMIKESANEAPIKGLKDAGPLLANARWMTVAVNFGNAPQIGLSANLADAAASKQLSDSINVALDDLKAQAANPNGGGPMAMFGPLIGPLVEGLRPATAGTQVTVALKGPSLTMIANFAAQMGVLGK